MVAGADREGFSLDPSCIHYGSNSGFQGANIGILRAPRVLLVGFDMTASNGGPHFFGDHPKGLTRNSNYERFIPAFNRAAKMLPLNIEIINCTSNSALRCFPKMDLIDALAAPS